ncbi:hypothetical protein [Alicyclobacillus acidoterrestris]|uniref:Uncharacterized protein n=1 Tax=Alicyclobacillus acidoterrestris (strain ATCC 49025 / DSM 3922 / CIP 106132 / NCIMB 13137 / GD3B) TaxID=1356854 RepID=T0D7Z8_ALIAG|nr:hypothetical protein [Alicyclobacillus acidoterrestris]EPZ47617.1 hypothetical protein N007_05005 [Alicyclobacillus acidoterrestris ATCC 49025]UNO48066.1 hypothetical protein K1I37_15440 [Alicyclobacillus acidoterrestris]
MDNEKLARIEEQVNGLRDDVVEIKDTIREQNVDMKTSLASVIQEISKVSERFVPRDQIMLMVQHRNERDDAQDSRLDKLEKKVDSLTAWRWYLAGAIALLGFIIVILGDVVSHLWK